MNANLLIDMVVRQTIVFIAQLATAPGTRASLVHVADRVLVSSSRNCDSRASGPR
jgi:hypothetical protein